MSCPSTTSCWAVGDTDSGPSLVEHWNGSSWKITTIPNPIDAPLFGVSCPSTTSCFVVGNNLINSLMDHWNGSSWSVMTIPEPTGSVETALEAVSCRSTTSCFAVGSYTGRDGIETLAERWNGSSWSVMDSPTPAGSIISSLYGVSCPSTTSCFAVGDYDAAGFSANPTLVEHWNGSRWNIMTSPTPTGSIISSLVSVSCPSTTSCFAVGYTLFGVLVEHWNGSSWKITAGPRASGEAALRGVSCPSTTSCFAVGDTGVKSLVEHWNGSSWSLMGSPNPPGSTLTVLEGVSCPSATSCFAVGFYKPLLSPDTSKTLVERYE